MDPLEYYDAPYLSEEEHEDTDHTGIPGVGGGGTPDLSDYQTDGEINLTSNGEEASVTLRAQTTAPGTALARLILDASVDGTNATLISNSENGEIGIEASGEAGQVNINANGAGGVVSIAGETAFLSGSGVTGLAVGISAGGTDGNVVIEANEGAGSITVRADDTGGGVNISASGDSGKVSVLAEGTDGEVEVIAAANINVQAPGANALISLNAAGDGGRVHLDASGTGNAIELFAQGEGGHINLAANGDNGYVDIVGDNHVAITSDNGVTATAPAIQIGSNLTNDVSIFSRLLNGVINFSAGDDGNSNPVCIVSLDSASGAVTISAPQAGGTVAILGPTETGVRVNADDVTILVADTTKFAVAADGVGFNGASPSIPEIPAIPLAQDIADVLVALGLATQAT